MFVIEHFILLATSAVGGEGSRNFCVCFFDIAAHQRLVVGQSSSSSVLTASLAVSGNPETVGDELSTVIDSNYLSQSVVEKSPTFRLRLSDYF